MNTLIRRLAKHALVGSSLLLLLTMALAVATPRAEAAAAGAAVTIYVWECDAGVNTSATTIAAYAQACPEPMDNVAFYLTDVPYLNPADYAHWLKGTTTGGGITFTNVPDLSAWLWEVVPAGFGTPVVFCTASTPKDVFSGALLGMPMASVGVTLGPATTFCNWFNVPIDVPVINWADQPPPVVDVSQPAINPIPSPPPVPEPEIPMPEPDPADGAEIVSIVVERTTGDTTPVREEQTVQVVIIPVACATVPLDPSSECETLAGVDVAVEVDGVELAESPLTTKPNSIGFNSAEVVVAADATLTLTEVGGLPAGLVPAPGYQPLFVVAGTLEVGGCGGESSCRYAYLINIPAGDSDGDGLSDEREAEIGCDPTNPDTDGDGRLDGDEVSSLRPSHPLRPDSDGDGLLDGADPDPTYADADNDGYNDGREIASGSDPTNGLSVPGNPAAGDSDGDHLADQRELQLGTDPYNPDTDGDGIEDSTELHLGTDPLDPFSA